MDDGAEISRGPAVALVDKRQGKEMIGHAGFLPDPGFAAVSGMQHEAFPAAYPSNSRRDKGHGAEVVLNPAFLELPGLAAIRRTDNHRVEAHYPGVLTVQAVNGKEIVRGNDGKGRLLGSGRLDPAA